jgi:hypothetical protein
MLMVIVKKPRMETWLNFLVLVALAECLRISAQTIWQWDYIYIPIEGKTFLKPAGSQGNFGWTGAMLAMCAPGFFRRRLWLGLLPVVGALYIQWSSTPLIAFAGGLCIFILMGGFPKPAKLVIVGAAVAGLAIYNIYDPVSENTRWMNWARAWALCVNRESWLMGFGQGSWIMLFPDHKAGFNFYRAHNEFLQVWFELGMAGLAAVLFYLGHAARAGALVLRHTAEGRFAITGLVTVVLCCMGNFPFHLAGTAMFCVVWIAMFENQIRRNDYVDRTLGTI